MEKFHPLVQKWFQQKFGQPTLVQKQTWPLIQKGENMLICAPTGSGKTLAAFLWFINQLICGTLSSGKVKVLYISPLKALNNDIEQNLLGPLAELDDFFLKHGHVQNAIQVAVRSGDTPQNLRQRMLRKPPEILITTPESLNNLLTSKNGRRLLTELKVVILDEIHAVVGSKRGTHLITAVDRLVEYSGEFQRIALSATVNPVKTIAAFVGGFRIIGSSKQAKYEPRPMAIVKSDSDKQYDIQVDFPANAVDQMVNKSWWPPLVETLKSAIADSDATLFFANSRRLTEKITRLINENETEILAYAHHGSLAKELRLAVEQKLKNGDLKAIVATSSLELGIDVGKLDMVGLIQTPMSVSSAIQRAGRAGHGIGKISRALIYPTFGLDFVCAATMTQAVRARDLEKIHPIEAPLDVLTQVILSMTCHQKRHIDQLYEFVKSSYPYRHLSRKQFDLIIAMLTGHYANIRIKELAPKLSFDRMSGILTAKKGTDLLIYLAGGTITDRGYFDLRMEASKAKIGELDEEFVWERSVGDTFALGTQIWRIKEITHNDVIVGPATGKWDIIPFWKAEVQNRNVYFCEKISNFLKEADQKTHSEEFARKLCSTYHMTAPAAKQLVNFLRLQKDKTGVSLPHRHHILIEHLEDISNQSDTKQVILHTFWGGKLNRPFALALSAVWEKRQKSPLQVFADNDGIILMLPDDFEAVCLFEWVTEKNLESLLVGKLEQTGFFGALFRENAGRALLLPKQQFKKRMPLWLNRLRAKKLLKSIQSFHDFPILLETFRTCLQDEFDLAGLKRRLREITQGRIHLSQIHLKSPSPFASGLVFRQTDLYMYSDDTPLSANGTTLKTEYIQDLIKSSNLRPRLPQKLLKTFQKKLQRTLEGYAPESDGELFDWLKERLMIPSDEWEDLLKASKISLKNSSFLSQIVKFSWPGSALFITSLEILPEFCKIFSIDIQTCSFEPLYYTDSKKSKAKIAQFKKDCIQHLTTIYQLSFQKEDAYLQTQADFMGQWLSYYGPISLKNIHNLWGLSKSDADKLTYQLVETSRAIVDFFCKDANEKEICASENLERLLYLYRQGQRRKAEPKPIENLPFFIAQIQGVGEAKNNIDDLKESLEKLFGYPLFPAAWEENVWPSRFETYQSSWLDTLMQNSSLIWFGCGDKKLSFAFEEDLDLFKNSEEKNESAILPGSAGKFSFFDVLTFNNLSAEETSQKLWRQSWEGYISNDTFEVVRKAIQTKYKVDPAPVSRHRMGRGAFNRWKNSHPMAGNWYTLPKLDPFDPLEEFEITRDRVRQLLLRYGVLFRQLLSRELKPLQWHRIFRALRLMEFSGEVFTGHFFSGISGLQFASKEALEHLKMPLDQKKIFWINATDPASLCGVDILELKSKLPSRKASTFLVYMGNRLILIAKRNGKELEFSIEPDHSRISESLKFFKALLHRDFNPLKKITVQKVNGLDVLQSPFLNPLLAFGFEKNYDRVELWKIL